MIASCVTAERPPDPENGNAGRTPGAGEPKLSRNNTTAPAQCVAVAVIAIKPKGTRVLFSRAANYAAGEELVRALRNLGLVAEVDGRPCLPMRPGSIVGGPDDPVAGHGPGPDGTDGPLVEVR